jgi:hypothetical protein
MEATLDYNRALPMGENKNVLEIGQGGPGFVDGGLQDVTLDPITQTLSSTFDVRGRAWTDRTEDARKTLAESTNARLKKAAQDLLKKVREDRDKIMALFPYDTYDFPTGWEGTNVDLVRTGRAVYTANAAGRVAILRARRAAARVPGDGGGGSESARAELLRAQRAQHAQRDQRAATRGTSTQDPEDPFGGGAEEGLEPSGTPYLLPSELNF